jgi:hypothetical protein
MQAIRWIAIVLLVFLGIGALIGAVPMLAEPHGAPLGMPQSMLRFTPFHSYLIPGLALLAGNGLLAFWAVFLALRRSSGYGLWIVVQCFLLRFFVWPQYLYVTWGLLLVACGLALRNDAATQS